MLLKAENENDLIVKKENKICTKSLKVEGKNVSKTYRLSYSRPHFVDINI